MSANCSGTGRLRDCSKFSCRKLNFKLRRWRERGRERSGKRERKESRREKIVVGEGGRKTTRDIVVGHYRPTNPEILVGTLRSRILV